MYGKVFESIYDGTLHGHWEAIVTMQQMVVLSDQDGVVDMLPAAISARTSIPLEIIEKGLEHLSKPDPFSRTPGDDGRRIVLLDDHRPWGWRLVNHAKYRALRDLEQKREADRDRQRARRRGELSPETQQEKGYVYFATVGSTGHIKIGYSKNPWARIKDLQVAQASEVRLMATMPGTVEDEAALHREFAELRLEGEWFRRSPTLTDRIKEISSKNKDVATADNYVAGVAHTDTNTDADTENNKSTVGLKPDAPSTQELRKQAVEIIAFLNEKAGKNYQPVKTNVDLIVARLREGGTVDDMRAIIAKKCREWMGRPDMEEFLRPATLFGPKNFWQKYQGELGK